jgi:RNA polymerase sigma-70 factor (ECF subfamily)
MSAAAEIAAGSAGVRAQGERDSSALARSARAGEPGSFRELYARYAPMVHGILIARVGASEAEDLCQEVFVAAWRGLARLERDEHVGAWIAGIARNQARRSSARAAPRPEPLSDDHPAREERGGDGAAILAAVRSLPQAYAETLTLRLVEGLSGPEIAALTGLAEGSVRVNLSRGMQLLRERLQREGLS